MVEISAVTVARTLCDLLHGMRNLLRGMTLALLREMTLAEVQDKDMAINLHKDIRAMTSRNKITGVDPINPQKDIRAVDRKKIMVVHPVDPVNQQGDTEVSQQHTKTRISIFELMNHHRADTAEDRCNRQSTIQVEGQLPSPIRA